MEGNIQVQRIMPVDKVQTLDALRLSRKIMQKVAGFITGELRVTSTRWEFIRQSSGVGNVPKKRKEYPTMPSLTVLRCKL